MSDIHLTQAWQYSSEARGEGETGAEGKMRLSEEGGKGCVFEQTESARRQIFPQRHQKEHGHLPP